MWCLFSGKGISSHRDIIVDRKHRRALLKYREVIAARNGLATYFSEVEGSKTTCWR
ncbi:MAG: hypothetical protein U5L09_02475 [Bacteroidales bacterium]|nr:hypothetical protein [Bacteroidales bacterium]